MKHGWIVMALLLTACASGPTQPAMRKQAETASQVAARASGEGKWTVAVQLWQEAARRHLALDDGQGVAIAALGQAQALQRLGRLEEATRLLDGLLLEGVYPVAQQAEARYQLALLRADQGEWAAVGRLLDTAERDAGQDAELRAAMDNLRGRAAWVAGDWAAVRQYAARALTTAGPGSGERANALRLQGQAAMRLQDWPAATQALEAALQLDKQLARPGGIAADLRALAELAALRADPSAPALAARAARVCEAAGAEYCRP